MGLSYRAGEIRLWTAKLGGLAPTTHYTRMRTYSELPDPAAESAARSDFFFYPSYPVAFEPRPVERRGDWLVYTPYTFACPYIYLRAIGPCAPSTAPQFGVGGIGYWPLRGISVSLPRRP